jgi:hypothetical protein
LRIVAVFLANKVPSLKKESMNNMNIPNDDFRSASPALPPTKELDPVFTPAEIMTATNRILPEKVHRIDGAPVAAPRDRVAFAQDIPKPTPIVPADCDVTEFAPGARPLRRMSSSRVFVDMSVPTPITTKWEAGQDAPILPAPHEAMLNAGESYTIRTADTGKIIASTESTPVM